jgi:hypothetical protein
MSCFSPRKLFLTTFHFTSRSRHPPILPLSLTISGFRSDPENPKATPALYHVLSYLFPIVALHPLSLDNLNNTPFRPEWKGEDLHSGLLQLPKGAILFLTEGAVAEGGIFNAGKFVPCRLYPKTEEMVHRYDEHSFSAANDGESNAGICISFQRI